MQRTQIAALQSFRSYINHCKTERRRESHEGEANGAKSTTVSSLRQVYKASSIQTLNSTHFMEFTGKHTWTTNWKLTLWAQDVYCCHWGYTLKTCICSSGPENLSTSWESHPGHFHSVIHLHTAEEGFPHCPLRFWWYHEFERFKIIFIASDKEVFHICLLNLD